MYRESEAMREIHKIQEKLYEEMKYMTDKQQVEYINRRAAEVEKKYNLNLRKVAHTG